MLDVRMLFSALVDADFLETEAHFDGTAATPRHYRAPGLPLEPEKAMELLRGYLEEVQRTSDAAEEVRIVRDMLMHDCLARAAGSRGLYTLTAPTGAGKTLAMLAFALEHARHHSGATGVRRVVLTIPFLSIIEQTAGIYQRIFRDVMGDEYVIEDHSQAGTEMRGTHDGDHSVPRPLTTEHDGARPRDRQRLLAQNWDAPIILTTSVQVLESLFANRPRACRKLHRLANSVLLFDEVQTLPPELAVVTLAAVSRLVERYGCTAVFATATQPAFEHLDGEVRKQCVPGWQPKEIVRDLDQMFEVSARRTWVEWRLDTPTPWAAVANELADQAQVLCVVNLKRHALGLLKMLEQKKNLEGLLHLSTNLCPAHRQRVLREVRERLRTGQPCRLIATQCIEAGVDVDFPSVYRALGPLEAIAQAAGRCNRGGKRDEPERVVVFVPERAANEKVLYPPGYGEAAEFAGAFVRRWKQKTTEENIKRIIHDPLAMEECFRQFYDLSGKANVPAILVSALTARDFERVAAAYRLIASDTVRVLVPYESEAYQRLRAEADPLPFEQARRWFARAAPLAVNIYRPGHDADVSGLIPVQVGPKLRDPSETDWFVLSDPDLYDCSRLGLRGIGGVWVI
jgi:hypothetical protein